MGFDLFQLVESGDFKNYDIFVCGICLEILKEPVMIKDCEHIYCNECICGWIVKEQTCPEDRQAITKDELVSPNRLFRNLYGKLKIKCLHFKNGCKEDVFLTNYEDHVNDCKFLLIECSQKCGFEGNKDKIGSHKCVDYLKGEIEKLNQELSETKRELSEAKLAKFQMNETLGSNIFAPCKSPFSPTCKQTEQKVKGFDFFSKQASNRFDFSAVQQSLFPSPITIGTARQEKATNVKFKAPIDTEYEVKCGIYTSFMIRYQCITAMKEYESKSLEELRWLNYQATLSTLSTSKVTMFPVANDI